MYLTIGNTDVSAYLTEDSFSCTYTPVYADGEYVNIYGERMRTKTGETAEIRAVLCDVDDTTARALRTALGMSTVSVGYISPQTEQAQMVCEKAEFSVERNTDGIFWTVSLVLCGSVRSCL